MHCYLSDVLLKILITNAHLFSTCRQSQEAINLAMQERSESMLYLIQRLLIKTDRTTADQVGLLRSQLSS